MTCIAAARYWRRVRFILGGALTIILVALAASPAQGQFQLGLRDANFDGAGSDAEAALAVTHASIARVTVYWGDIAPGVKPKGFDEANPADPSYTWGSLDAEVRAAAQHGLTLLLTFADAPTWAEGPGHPSRYVSSGAWNPKASDFANFLHAVAVRYGGAFPDPLNTGTDLPRVRDWEVWNEPNIPGYYSAPDPVSAYRTLYTRAYSVLKAVHRDNVVELGGLAPVSPVPGSIPPLQFGADLLCLNRNGSRLTPKRGCRRISFDAFGIHPYSLAATPTKHAYTNGDVLVGDMGDVGALVRAAQRLHTTASPGAHPIWVTEFGWFTNPPDTIVGDPPLVAARYVAYSMYEMWASGTTMVIWETLRDSDTADIPGGGLYTGAGAPKPMLEAYAFPFVASVSGARGYAWGRAAVSHRERLIVERKAGRRWVRVAIAITGADGVFQARFRASGRASYRAVVGRLTSLPYDSRPIPPRRTHAFNP